LHRSTYLSRGMSVFSERSIFASQPMAVSNPVMEVGRNEFDLSVRKETNTPSSSRSVGIGTQRRPLRPNVSVPGPRQKGLCSRDGGLGSEAEVRLNTIGRPVCARKRTLRVYEYRASCVTQGSQCVYECLHQPGSSPDGDGS